MSSRPSHFRVILIGLVSLAIAMGIGRFAFTPLLPLMRDEGLVGITEGGILASVHFLGYWLGAVFAARLPFAPRPVLRLSLITIGLCTLGMGVTDSFPAWLILRWLTGVCSAFTLVLVGNYTVKYLADMGRAESRGWVFSGVGAGIAVAGLGVLAFMAAHIGGALGWRILGIVSLVLAFAVCARIGEDVPGTRRQASDRYPRRTPLSWSIVIAYGAAGIGYVIPATYLPVMAREIVRSPLLFGWSWPVFGLAAFISTLLAARLGRRFSNRRIWVTSQIVMAVGLLAPVIHPSMATIVIAGIAVGGTFMIVTMAGMMEARRIAPAHDVMRHIAAMTTAFATGQMIGPVLASSIHELTGSFSAALVLASITLVVTAAALLVGSSKEAATSARSSS